MSDILYAFWDFAADTPAGDLPVFLAAADLARRRAGYERCHLVLCDRTAEGTDPDGEVEWRLWNEIIPTVWLLPAGQCFTLCRSAAEIADLAELAGVHAFPPPRGGPDLTAPHPDRTGASWLPTLDAPPPLRATPQARDYAGQWLEERARGRLVVTLSLVGTGDGLPAEPWAAFAAALDPERVLPVVLPGPPAAPLPLGDGWGAALPYAEAAENVELRMALYEASDLVLLDDPFGAALALLGAETRSVAFGEAPAIPASPTRRRTGGPADAATLASEYRRMADLLALPPLGPSFPAGGRARP